MQSSRPSHTHPSVWANFALGLAGCLWGTGFLFGKIAFREMSVSENVTFRFGIAAIVLIPLLFRHRITFTRKDFTLLILAALVGVPVQFLIQFKGLQLTTVSHASLIVGTLPVLIALTSAIFLHERLSRVEWIILLLSPLGVVAIAVSGGSNNSNAGPTLIGDMLVLVSMFAAVFMIMITKRLTAKYNPTQITAWMLILGTILLAAGTFLTQPMRFHFSAEAWSAVAAQGILATVGAYVLWNWGLARVEASRAGVFLNLEPLFGTFLGVVVLHETLRAWGLVGAAMIIGPAVYFSRKKAEA